MNEERNPGAAKEFAHSMRGQYILSQALHHGIKALEGVEPKLREESNLNDMRYLYNELLPLYGVAVGIEQSGLGEKFDRAEEAKPEGEEK